MSEHCALTIVVGVKDASANLEELVSRLSTAISSEIEVLLMFAGAPPRGWTPPLGIQVVSCPASSLVPELWRDGIVRARGRHLALTTAHCLPSPDWVHGLLAADLSNHVGVGGLIALDPGCSASHKAIYLLRYSAFAPPQTARNVSDIAADNAIYRRAEIIEHADLLAKGFWEPSFHRRFAANGLSLRLDPSIRVFYRGQERAGAFAAQRMQHGREYGESRSAELPVGQRIGLLLASPLVPFIIATRVIRRTLSNRAYARALPLASPWLVWFIASWSIGEFSGYLNAISGPRHEGEGS